MTPEKVKEIAQELYDEGGIIKKLDDKGRPVLQSDTYGELQPVYIHHQFATPTERAFWLHEHPGVKSAAAWSGNLEVKDVEARSMTSAELKRRLFALVEGLDQRVESAADLKWDLPGDAGGLDVGMLLVWFEEFRNMTAEEKEEEMPELLFSLAKALKNGTVDLADVM